MADGLYQKPVAIQGQLAGLVTFRIALVEGMTGVSLQALVALSARLDAQAQQVDVRHAEALAIADGQAAGLQQCGVGKGRGGQHHLLAVSEVRARAAVEMPVTADIAA